MDYFLLYLILRLDAISETVLMLAIITGVLFLVAVLIFMLNDKETVRDRIKPWTKIFGIPFAIVLFFTVMTPGTKQAAVIYCLPKIVNNEQIQKMPDNLLRLANQWIDGQITETTKTVAKVTENEAD